MKKNRKYGPVMSPCGLKKVFMVSKLTLLMTVCLIHGLSASVWSQQKVTMDLGYATVKEVLAEFQRQTGQFVIYSSEKLDTKQKVRADFKSADVETFLSSVLEESGMSYKVMNDYILIVPREKTVSQSQTAEKEIHGMVVDESGMPLPGVSVLIKGTSIGVATDMDGKFAIKIPDIKDLALVFSFIGMENREIVYKGQSNLKVVLKESVSEMDEVVVTGYQEVKKARMTGAVEVLTAKDIVNKGYVSVNDVLKGTLAGVTTMSVSGRPGAEAQIRIRGINSLTGNTDPIWIIDGMPLQGDLPDVGLGATDLQNSVLTSGVGNLAPDDIESITILKDAAATAIYGSRAANGVIVVKTKRGSVGQSYINISSSFSIDEAPRNKLKMMNTTEKIAFERGIYEDFPQVAVNGRITRLLQNADAGRISRSEAEAEIARLSGVNTNWFDEIFEMAFNHNHTVTLSGGSERTTYYASLNYLSQEGVMPNNKYDRLGANLKLTHDFNKRLRVNFDLSTSLRNDRSSASIVDPLFYATYANPYERPYDEDGNYEYDRSYEPDMSSVKDGYMYDFNILKDLNENTQRTRYISNQLNLKLEYQLFKGMMYSLSGTFSNTSSHTRSVLAPGSYSSKSSSWLKDIYSEGEIPDYLNNGSLTERHSNSQGWTVRNQFEFARSFKEDHYVNIVLGQEASSTRNYGFTSYFPEYDSDRALTSLPDLAGIDASSLDLSKLAGSTQEGQDKSVSFFASGSYTYKNRYVAAGSYRLDGADIIGKANRFSPLWNVSAKWNLYEEDFIKNLPFIDVLSVRASYGFTGSIDRNAYPFTVMAYKNARRYNGELVPFQVDPANPNIKWQKKEDRNVGLDASLFKNRLNFSVNYYNNDTRNLLDDKKVSISSGRPSVTANVSSLKNSGWEFSLTTVNVDYKDFRWSTSFNIAINKNRVMDTYYESISDLPVSTRGRTFYVKDQPVNAWYGFKYAGIDPLTGHTLAYVDAKDQFGNPLGHRQADGTYVYDTDTEECKGAVQYLGEAYPPITGGFGTQLSFRRFSLGAQFSFMTGHKIKSFNSSYIDTPVYASRLNQYKTEVNRWRKPGDITDIAGYDTNYTAYTLDFFDYKVENGAFVKCNNVSFGYNLDPELCSKLYLTRARFSFNAQNLFTWTKYRGIDPETMGAFGYPSARKYVFTLSLGI